MARARKRRYLESCAPFKGKKPRENKRIRSAVGASPCGRQKKGHYLPPEERKCEHWINIACDALAAEGRAAAAYDAQYWAQPAATPEYRGERFLRGLRELIDEIQWERIAAEIATQDRIWGPFHKLSLQEIRTQHKKTEIRTLVSLMKLRWRLLATNHVA